MVINVGFDRRVDGAEAYAFHLIINAHGPAGDQICVFLTENHPRALIASEQPSIPSLRNGRSFERGWHSKCAHTRQTDDRSGEKLGEQHIY